MAEIISFDGQRRRVSVAMQNPQVADVQRKSPGHAHPANVRRIVALYFSGMTSTAIARREGIGTNDVDRVIQQNSRPVDPKTPALALDRRLRRAA